MNTTESSSQHHQSIDFQQHEWSRIQHRINILINQLEENNILDTINQLFDINVIRGLNLFIQSTIQAQDASPDRSPVYAATISYINRWIQVVGETIAKNLIVLFKQEKLNKMKCIKILTFIAHIINQNIVCINKHIK